MNSPELIQAEDFKPGGINTQNYSSADGGRSWVFDRGLRRRGFQIRRRLSLAWGVLIGKYDALKWSS